MILISKLIRSKDEIQKSQGQSLLEILSRSPTNSDTGDGGERRAVIGQALHILSRIHTSFVTPAGEQDQVENATAQDEDPALEDAKRRRLLHALLDLISLEGIYPSLSSGVGIPLQQRVISVLPAGVIAKQNAVPASSKPHDETILCQIMSVILNIMLDTTPSIQPVIRGRILSDIISGTTDLAFNPNIQASPDQSYYKNGLLKTIEEYVTA